MKILIVSTLYPPNIIGGAERSTAILAQALVEDGLEVVVITLNPKGGETEVLYRNGVKIYYVPLKNIYFPFTSKKPSSIWRFLWHVLDTSNGHMAHVATKIIEQEKPDLVHTNTIAGFSTSIWKGIRDLNIPTLHTLRDHYLLCPRTTMFRKEQNCQTLCLECRLLANPRIQSSVNINAVTGVSQFIVDQHLQYGAFAKTPIREVIFNAFISDKSPIKIKEFGATPFRFGYFGRLEPNKGIEDLLNAFGKLPSNVELWVGGRGLGSYETAIKEKFRNTRIRFLGFVKPVDFYPYINVLVQPSLLNETFGRTIIEAYSYGKPVLISRRGGSPEIVEEYQTGLLFEPDHLTELVTSLEWYLGNPQKVKEMGVQALLKSKEFSPKQISEKTILIYKRILEV